jgi:ribosomal-protein-alanine N-acetyltransferase
MVQGCQRAPRKGRDTVTDPATTVLETERLILRRLTMDDLEALAKTYADPQVRQYFPEGTLTHKETKEELEWIIDVYYGRYGFGLWATIYKEKGEFIGRCGLLPWKVIESRDGGIALTSAGDETIGPAGIEVEVAYLLAKEYWGRGLGTEAAQAIVDYSFEQLQMTRLICLFDPENQASRKVAGKVGFTFESNVEIGGEQVPLSSLSKIRPS